MSLTRQDVVRIAKLARIAITNDEATQLNKELNSIFNMVEVMQLTDTDHVEPMTHPQDLFLHLRPDEVSETNERDTFLALAPQTKDGLFLVPKVIE